MDELRVILLVLGIGVVAFVYWHSRRQSRRASADPERRVEPALDADSPKVEPEEEDDLPLEPMAADSAESAPAAPEAPVEQKIVTLRLVARGDSHFNGEQVVLTLRGLGLRHGKFGIFHRVDGADDDSIVFSVASLVEPGTFDLANIRQQELPGVSMFMVLPGPKDGAEAFDEMIATARAMADSLHGELLDEAGSTMSIQRERFLREEIIQYQHGLAVV